MAGALLALPQPLRAQEAPAPATGGFADESLPLEIGADQGIEWRETEKIYIARGNATVKRGDTTLAADVLTFSASEAGGDIDRIAAVGHVKLTTANAVSYGEKGDYDSTSKLLVLSGGDLRIENDTEKVRAADSLEFWSDKDAIVAKGKVEIEREGTELAGDHAVLYFKKDASGKSKLSQIEIDGHVRANNGKQRASAQRLLYNPDTEISVLTGNVRVIDGKNEFRGAKAEIDDRRKVSRLLGGGGSRVISIIQPKKKTDTPPATNP